MPFHLRRPSASATPTSSTIRHARNQHSRLCDNSSICTARGTSPAESSSSAQIYRGLQSSAHQAGTAVAGSFHHRSLVQHEHAAAAYASCLQASLQCAGLRLLRRDRTAALRQRVGQVETQGDCARTRHHRVPGAGQLSASAQLPQVHLVCQIRGDRRHSRLGIHVPERIGLRWR